MQFSYAILQGREGGELIILRRKNIVNGAVQKIMFMKVWTVKFIKKITEGRLTRIKDRRGNKVLYLLQDDKTIIKIHI